MALKHGDRTESVKPAAVWLRNICHDIIKPQSVIVPVPLHWRRQFMRKYNQASLLADALAKLTNTVFVPNALRRSKYTASLDKRPAPERMEILQGSFEVDENFARRYGNRPILIIDDVMTTGATLANATRALNAKNVTQIDVAVLARALQGND